MRGLKSTRSQLSLPVEAGGVGRVWESMSAAGAGAGVAAAGQCHRPGGERSGGGER